MPTASDERARSARAASAGSYARASVAVGQVQQSERREDRDRLAELQVIRRQPSPQRRIVHARQVVEDQRRRVNELDCGGGGERPAGRSAAQLRATAASAPAARASRGVQRVGHRSLRRGSPPRRHERPQFRVHARLVVGEERRNRRSSRRASRPFRTRACTDNGGNPSARHQRRPAASASLMTRSGSTRSSIGGPGPQPSLVKSTIPMRPSGFNDLRDVPQQHDRFFHLVIRVDDQHGIELARGQPGSDAVPSIVLDAAAAPLSSDPSVDRLDHLALDVLRVDACRSARRAWRAGS